MSVSTYKAYSLLTEKSFEDGDQVIRGYATTPTPDRVLDVVVPDGVVFRTRDIKLLMHHDNRLPVGTVQFGTPDKKGLPFEARLPNVKEPGVVRDRVTEAIHSIKYGLISAVSIGFRALEDGVERLKSGGLKFNKWEMIELSLTPTPMQTEAIFSIAKSLRDNGRLPDEVMSYIRYLDTQSFKSMPDDEFIRAFHESAAAAALASAGELRDDVAPAAAEAVQPKRGPVRLIKDARRKPKYIKINVR